MIAPKNTMRNLSASMSPRKNLARAAVLPLLALAPLLLAAAGARSEEISREAVEKLLKENPKIILDILESHKAELFNMVNQGAQEAREQQQQKDLDESFKNPLTPEIPENARIRGNKNAKYTLVEYSDFECPYCRRGYSTVEELRNKYGKDLRFIYKNLPLPMHKQAMPAAQYFEALSLQSEEKAWKLHDIMYQEQDKLSADFLREAARRVGADMARLEKDLKSDKVQKAIQADQKEAQSFGFDGTPGFLLNGVPIRGAYPVEHFDAIIKKLSGKAAENAPNQGP